MNEVEKKRGAAIYATDRFVCVQTSSGYRQMGRDPDAKLLFLDAEPSATALGSALQEALGASRFLSSEESKALLRREAVAQRYEDWVSHLMRQFGYATRRDLFKGMKHCLVRCNYETITIGPSIHDQLEGWGGTGKENDVHVSSAASADELGRAVLLALSRCIG